jgi:hypothetical protein
MASASSIALRRSNAEKRTRHAAERIARVADVPMPEAPARAKDPDIRAAVDMEWVASIMRALADNLDPDGAGGSDLPEHVVNEYVAPPPDETPAPPVVVAEDDKPRRKK